MIMCCVSLVLEGLLDFLVPLCKVRVKQTVSPWATNSDIATAHRYRDKLHQRALLTGSQSDRKLFHAARNKVNGLLESAKWCYITELASPHKGRPSKFWSHFQYLSSHGNMSASPTDFSFHADDLICIFCVFLAGQCKVFLFHLCLYCHMFQRLMYHL